MSSETAFKILGIIAAVAITASLGAASLLMPSSAFAAQIERNSLSIVDSDDASQENVQFLGQTAIIESDNESDSDATNSAYRIDGGKWRYYSNTVQSQETTTTQSQTFISESSNGYEDDDFFVVSQCGSYVGGCLSDDT